MLKSLILATDLDDVILQFVPQFVKFHNFVYPEISLRTKDFHSYNFPEVLKVSTEETKKRLQDFYYSPFHKEIKLMPGALKAFYSLKKVGFKIFVITGRHKSTFDITRELIEKRIPGNLLEDILYTNAHDSNGAKIKKSDMCIKIGSQTLIDDDLMHIEDCCSVGIKTFVYSHTWNKGFLPLEAIRTNSWKILEEKIIKAYSLF